MSDSSDQSRGVLRIERTFDAPAQAVFDAWTSVEVLRRWWHAEHDWETPHAEVDLRVGGTIHATMRNPDDGAEYGGRGEFTVVAPPERLVFTWTWDDVPGSQLIEVDFRERDGRTTVTLTHRGLDDESRDAYRDGWDKSFDNLDRALAA
jgi:uncharacterized protein YndB with AHSA1/START domain